MLRRLFWFVSGAVAGIAGVAWVKRRATEMREAITLASVLRSMRDLAVFLFQRIEVGFSSIRGYVGGEKIEETLSAPSAVARPAQRRHIASRPHNSHR